MSLKEYADRFRVRNPNIPEQLYGKFAKIENIAKQAKRAQEEETPKQAENYLNM